MKHPHANSPGTFPALILACLLVAACASTQKGSSGSGTQEAAPISEAGKADTGGASSATSDPSSAAASSSAATSGAGADASPGSRQSAAAAAGDAEAARLQQQLADQEAQINRIRDEQVSAQRLAEDEAARQKGAEAAAQAEAAAIAERQRESEAAQQSAAAAAAAAAGAASQEAAAARAREAGAGGAREAGDQSIADQPIQRSIYFKYDDASIGDEYDSVLIAHAAFLKAHPDYKAEVQGNCDERGSREYNLALGARRAEAVKRGLELAGADGSRVKTVSFGAEKPVAFGKDEESYRKNRRVDILY